MLRRGRFASPVAVALAALALWVPGCASGGDEETSAPDGTGKSAPAALPEADRQVLDQSVAEGHGDRVAAAGEDPEVCEALAGAVEASKALDAVSGAELVALLGPSQAPMDRAARVLAAKGFDLTAEYYGRYRNALVASEADIDMADQASRDRANDRFAAVRAQGAGATATELGGLAIVCGVA